MSNKTCGKGLDSMESTCCKQLTQADNLDYSTARLRHVKLARWPCSIAHTCNFFVVSTFITAVVVTNVILRIYHHVKRLLIWTRPWQSATSCCSSKQVSAGSRQQLPDCISGLRMLARLNACTVAVRSLPSFRRTMEDPTPCNIYGMTAF